ncbi:MAG: hypothetical protein AAB676_21250 [Verrucomicrobiota bacterium]
MAVRDYHRPKNLSSFAIAAASIFMSGSDGSRPEPFAGQFLRRVKSEFAAEGHFAGGVVEHVGQD